ncbi:MAG: metallophosphoesterase [Planctomycetes bacterium]|nr:metallophosphoesterase [Planctomycetota bacterium]
MRKIISLISAILIISTLSQAGETFVVEKPEGGAPWTSLEANNKSENFQFVIVADRTGGCRNGVFDQAMDKINLLQPEFVVSIGDLIQGYAKEATKLKEQHAEIDRMIAKLEMPFFYIPGNHDIVDELHEEEYRKRYGKTYYHFLYHRTLFLCLNTEESPQGVEHGYFSPEQIAYVRKVLADHQEVRWTFVFMHKPVFCSYQHGGHAGWDQIEEALQGRSYTVFAGHNHDYTWEEKDGNDYITLATTGGRNALRGDAFGEFDHLVWVTMTDDGPRIVNLMLDGIREKKIRTRQETNFIYSLEDGRIVEIKPLFTDSVFVDHLETRLQIANPSPQKIRIEGSITAETPWMVMPTDFDFEIPGNTTQAIPITLKSDVSYGVGAIAKPTLKFSWEIAWAEDEGQQPYTFKGNRNLGITRKQVCPRLTNEVVVDGKLDDWTALPYTLEGPWQITPKQLYPEEATKPYLGWNDLLGRFGTAFDDEYLYIAVEAIDDHLLIDSTRMWHWHDGTEIWLDARPNPSREQPHGENRCAWQAVIMANPPTEPGSREIERTYYSLPPMPQGTKVICARTETGHITEVKIPLALLSEKQEQPWQGFNLNIAINDFDYARKDSRNGLHHSWQPDWNGEKAFAGEGYFTKP